MKRALPAITVFAGSALLFVLQPLLGRTLLPPFGGTAAVWTVCLAAYQALLLAGYLYAHALAKRPPRAQRALHAALLALAAVWAAGFAFLRPALTGAAGGGGAPALEVLLCVLLFAGVPYVLLSAGSSLVQAWVSGHEDEAGERPGARGVYRLYAVSNLGSLLGLLAYPFALEPFVPLAAQWWGFAACLAAYAALVSLAGRRLMPRGPGAPAAAPGAAPAAAPAPAGGAGVPPAAQPRPPRRHSFLSVPSFQSSIANRCSLIANSPAPPAPLLWLALPALSSFTLVAVTGRLTLETTPMPLFWVLLLSAFLLSWVAGFSGLCARLLAPAFFAALASCVWAGAAQRLDAASAFEWLLLPGVAFLFFGGTFLHGWLYAARPAPELLTRFYLGVAAGGAAGGAAGSLLAPLLFRTVAEFPLAVALVALAGWRFARNAPLGGNARRAACCLAVAAAVCAALCRAPLAAGHRVIARERNFYGTLRVERAVLKSALGSEQAVHYFKHGNTTHGLQFRGSGLSLLPTAYYGEHAGGFPIASHPKRLAGKPLRVGVVGLGVGVLAAHGLEGDTFRFYEINPQVVGIATNPALFSFLADCPASVGIAGGDARKRLEEERARGEEGFDALVVDVFSGDSIAPHMVSAEAFALYRDRLAEGGILGVHVSNWHIDLFPVCKAAAARLGMNVAGVAAQADAARGEMPSMWAFLSDAPLPPPPAKSREVDFSRVRDIVPPADGCGSLLGLIRFIEPPPLKPQGP